MTDYDVLSFITSVPTWVIGWQKHSWNHLLC